MTWFVHRNADGSLASIHRELMPGYNDEQVADGAAEIGAFLNPPPKFDAYSPYIAFLLVELVTDLLAKGTIAATDFSATTRTVYTRAKALLATAEQLLPPPP